MSTMTIGQMQHVVEEVYRTESRRVLATLIRLLGDFDLAEDAMQDAFAVALRQWSTEGVPDNPRAWLVSTGRFKAIDNLRKRARFDRSLPALAEQIDEANSEFDDVLNDETIGDDRLRLVFTCCHPALSPEARIALTLREMCGLTTEEIARAFLTRPSTLAQRIVRAKSKIRDAGIPYQVPGPKELPERLGTVLHVIYLVFNEGYSASSGESLTRADLSAEAIRLNRLLLKMLPEAEVKGLLALMLLHESRRFARTSADGDIVLLDDQDRTLWDQALIAEGLALVNDSLSSGEVGPYTVQAAISAVHARARSAEETDWKEIVYLYDLLMAASPSPVIELNRAVAVAMVEGPQRGVDLIEAILDRGELGEYHLAHSARAEMYRRLGRANEARVAYVRALALTQLAPERRFLEQRLGQLDDGRVDP